MATFPPTIGAALWTLHLQVVAVRRCGLAGGRGWLCVFIASPYFLFSVSVSYLGLKLPAPAGTPPHYNGLSSLWTHNPKGIFSSISSFWWWFWSQQSIWDAHPWIYGTHNWSFCSLFDLTENAKTTTKKPSHFKSGVYKCSRHTFKGTNGSQIGLCSKSVWTLQTEIISSKDILHVAVF